MVRKSASLSTLAALCLWGCGAGDLDSEALEVTSGMLSAQPPRTAAECLASSNKRSLSGVGRVAVAIGKPGPRFTLDLRDYTNRYFGADARTEHSALKVGGGNSGSDPVVDGCVVGGYFEGQQSKNLLWWSGMKNIHDQPTVLLGTSTKEAGTQKTLIVNGTRMYNVMDGVAHSGNNPDNYYLTNTYFQYLRDDAVENEHKTSNLLVHDNLWDGVFMGVAWRSNETDDTSNIVVSNTHIRLEQMPHSGGDSVYKKAAEDGKAFGWFWKQGSKHVRFSMKDSVLYADEMSVNGLNSMSPGPNFTFENVTLIYTGANANELKRRFANHPGVHFSTDVSLWTEAKRSWLERHGCTADVKESCTKITSPDPL